jgi:hypothetical protein
VDEEPFPLAFSTKASFFLYKAIYCFTERLLDVWMNIVVGESVVALEFSPDLFPRLIAFLTAFRFHCTGYFQSFWLMLLTIAKQGIRAMRTLIFQWNPQILLLFPPGLEAFRNRRSLSH